MRCLVIAIATTFCATVGSRSSAPRAGAMMSSLFAPDTPPPAQPTADDLQAKALREQEQKRAEQNRTAATQDQLKQETLIRGRRYGTRSLLGSFSSGGSLLGAG